MARKRILGAYNIPSAILTEAERLGLEAMSTGGGLDYIYKDLGKNGDKSRRMVLLGDPDDAGSPDRLTSKCCLIITLNEEWNDAVTIPVGNVRDGMQLMVKMYDYYA